MYAKPLLQFLVLAGREMYANLQHNHILGEIPREPPVGGGKPPRRRGDTPVISGRVGRGRPPKRSGRRSFRYEFMHLVALNSLRTGKREGRRIFGASTGPFQGVINPFEPCIRDAKCRLLCEALGAVRDKHWYIMYAHKDRQ